MEIRLQEILRLPTDQQLAHELSVYILPELADLVLGYTHLPTHDLVLMHFNSVRDEFLTVSECLELVDDTSSCRRGFLRYLHLMFAGVPPLAEWPCNLQYRAMHNLLQRKHPVRWNNFLQDHVPTPFSMGRSLQAHIGDLQTWHQCTECVVEVLSNAESIIDSLPHSGSTLAIRYKKARAAELTFLGLCGLGLLALAKTCVRLAGDINLLQAKIKSGFGM